MDELRSCAQRRTVAFADVTAKRPHFPPVNSVRVFSDHFGYHNGQPCDDGGNAPDAGGEKVVRGGS
jgi:hypothetical protein